MLSNALTDRIRIQVRTATLGATGMTEVWKPVEARFARVVPLDAKARAVYQQMQSEVTHKIILRGAVSLTLGDNRFLWKDKTLTPVGPTQELDNTTVIMVKED